MTIRSAVALLLLALPSVGPAADVSPAGAVCHATRGTQDGLYHQLWFDTGTGCLTLGPGGGYRVVWRLGTNGNLVAGRGWARGSATRVVGYRAAAFDPGRNGYLSLYGWSTDPLVEYYVVDNWGGFVPPGPGGTYMGMVASDGGTYAIYRTRRVDQPSIRGTATFDQYWSVRTVQRPTGRENRITVANHVRAWASHGMPLGTLDYQILATEGYGSDGRADVTVWER